MSVVRQENGAVQQVGLSKSKLGVYVMNEALGAQKILPNGPKIIVAFDPHRLPAVMQLIREYKAMFPGGSVVMRVFDGTQDLHYTTSDDPEASATDFWQTALLPAVDALQPADRQLIDYLIGPNEYSNYPPLSSTTASWIGRFWARLALHIAQAGLKPVLGEIPVGNPDAGTLDQIMPWLVPALQTIRSFGGAWSYHAYTLEYSTDPETEIWYSLRYRQFYSYLRRNYPDLGNMPLILTETGVDQEGSPATSGWKARGDAARYQHWLRWFDYQMQRDDYILGSTIFQIGDLYWSSFNIEDIADWLANYLHDAQFSKIFLPAIHVSS